MSERWVKLYAKILDSRVFANADMLKLWVLCLARANFKDTWVHIEGRTSPVQVKRGEFIAGRYTLHDAFYPKPSSSDKSPRTVWRWLKVLEAMGNVSIKTHAKFSVVSVVNYRVYQSGDSEHEQENVQQHVQQDVGVSPEKTRVSPTTDLEHVQHVSSTCPQSRRFKKVVDKEEPYGSSTAQPKVVTAKSEFSFPLVGGSTWTLPQKKLNEYLATHADQIDVAYELRKAHQWLVDNKDRRPRSARGMAAFLTRWLNRASDSKPSTMPGSRVATVPDEGGVFNPETGEIVKPMK